MQNNGVALKADMDLIPVPDEEVVKERMLKKGDDHTIMQALLSLDFWLLFVATVFGVGSGLTATDNMAQLGLSLGYASKTYFFSNHIYIGGTNTNNFFTYLLTNTLKNFVLFYLKNQFKLFSYICTVDM